MGANCATAISDHRPYAQGTEKLLLWDESDQDLAQLKIVEPPGQSQQTIQTLHMSEALGRVVVAVCSGGDVRVFSRRGLGLCEFRCAESRPALVPGQPLRGAS